MIKRLGGSGLLTGKYWQVLIKCYAFMFVNTLVAFVGLWLVGMTDWVYNSNWTLPLIKGIPILVIPLAIWLSLLKFIHRD